MEATLEQKIRQLPEDKQREVSDYVDFLLSKYPSHKPVKHKAGFMQGCVTWMSDDFNAPPDDFKEYM